VAQAGHVRVLAWGGPIFGWVQLGSDINGENEYDFLGSSLALSGDGATVAVGAYGVGDFLGEVRILRWSGTDWLQLGARISGDAANDYLGVELALSDNGNTVAVGAQHMVR
jgi:hypothetical protein